MADRPCETQRYESTPRGFYLIANESRLPRRRRYGELFSDIIAGVLPPCNPSPRVGGGLS